MATESKAPIVVNQTATSTGEGFTWAEGHAFDSTARPVRANDWMVVGKPTLRQLLRYWWRSR